MADIHRRKTVTVRIGDGDGIVRVGSEAPVVVQSMTNTDTADAPGTIQQVAALAAAGSELVRVTVNNDEAAKAVPQIVEGLHRLGQTIQQRGSAERVRSGKSLQLPGIPVRSARKQRTDNLGVKLGERGRQLREHHRNELTRRCGHEDRRAVEP